MAGRGQVQEVCWDQERRWWGERGDLRCRLMPGTTLSDAASVASLRVA
jgi:hypothetical protein